MTDLEKDILQAAQTGVAKAIHEALNGYHGPMQKLVNRVVDENQDKLLNVMKEGFSTVIGTDEFKQSVVDAFQHKIAKLMVTKLEGSVEKAVNALRNDPTIRAKMVLAIENVIKEHQPA